MPKKSVKKSKKGRKAPKRQGQGGGRQTAPAAVSTFVKQRIEFYGTGETLGLRGKLAIFDVKTEGVAGTTSGLIGSTALGVAAVRLSPIQPTCTSNAPAYATVVGFISPALDLISSAFTRYKMKKCKFHYLPLFTTNSTQQLIFGFAADPCHPLLSGVTAAVPTYSGIESISDSRPFAPWVEWEMDVTNKLTKEWLYMSTNGNDTTSGNDTARFDNWGSIGCVVATPSTATAERYGVLYLDFDIELKEFCPISVARPSLLRALNEKLSHHIEKHQARMAQGESKENSQPSTGIDVSSLFDSSGEKPSSSKPLYKELDLEDFIHAYRTRRDEHGMSASQAISDLSGEYILSARCMRLVIESGLAQFLQSPLADTLEVPEGEKEECQLSPSLGVVTFADVKKPSVSNPKEGLK